MILFPLSTLKTVSVCASSLATWRVLPYSMTTPLLRPRAFEDQGFQYLHIVDLNGAFEGKPVNGAAVEAILGAITIPAQLGGGIRDLETISMWIDKGISRVILGTVAVRNPELVIEACKQFPGHIAVGIDARDGKVAIEGWDELSEMTAIDLAKKFEDAGVSAIIYTDIARDGILKGLNFEGTRALADAVSIPVIASGGLASMDDIKELIKPENAKLEGRYLWARII